VVDFGNWDASLNKNPRMMGRFNLQLWEESFDFLNLPNPEGFGSTNNPSSLFGQITSFRAPGVFGLPPNCVLVRRGLSLTREPDCVFLVD